MRDFNHTIGGLVKAYLNGTLKHGDCDACAVGNIVGGSHWQYFFMTVIFSDTRMEQMLNYSKLEKTGLEWRMVRAEGQKLISDSGYTKKELARIEWAFETAPRNCSTLEGENEEWMFNGLMAVVDVLADIHGISLEAKEKSKLLFVKL